VRHDIPSRQVRQVGIQAVQLVLPESKNPLMQSQSLVMSLRRVSTQVAQAPLGELQVWHLVGHLWHVVPLTKYPSPQEQVEVTLLRIPPVAQVMHLLGAAGSHSSQKRAEQG